MRNRARSGALAMVVGFSAAITLGSVSLLAQEPASGKAGDASKPAAAKGGYDPIRRVPAYFGQIGLTPEQREEIYKARGKHLVRIAELEKQIDAIKAELMSDCEKVLTDTQKQLLEHRRRAASEKKKAPSAEPASPTKPTEAKSQN